MTHKGHSDDYFIIESKMRTELCNIIFNHVQPQSFGYEGVYSKDA